MSLLDKTPLDPLNQNFSKRVCLDQLDSFAFALLKKADFFSTLCFYGDLGAGKTTLIRSLSAACGVDKRNVTSPTYVYLHHYKSEKSRSDLFEIAHFDLYRLGSSENFFAMGWEEYLENSLEQSSAENQQARRLTFIEWPERLEGRLPKKRLDIEIKIVDREARDITIYERS